MGSSVAGPTGRGQALWHRLARVEPTSAEHSVTPLELLFDVVFVFAITQVTAFMADELGWRGLLRGLAMLALLWWAWCSYAWLGNQARADEGLLRAALIVAMAARYFDVMAPIAEGVLHRRTGAERIRLVRDSYTYLHFPMVAGIIYLALGLKKAAQYVGDVEHHHLSDPLPLAALLALYGGAVAYLLAHVAFRLRNLRSVNRPRAVVIVLLIVTAPAVSRAPTLVGLAVLALVVVMLTGYEAVRYADARAAIRHGDAR